MPYYICAHYPDDSLILGNGDGQTCLRHRRPERSSAWRALGVTILSPRVAYWTLQTSFGDILLRKPNPNHRSSHATT